MTPVNFCQLVAETLGERYTCSPVNRFIRIRTPYLYPDGEVIDLFLKEQSQVLTDLGETFRWLDMQTLSQGLSNQQDFFLQDIQLTYGIEVYQGMLIVRVQEDLGDAVNRLVQAAISVSNLRCLSQNCQ
jgi:hypothetical protein